MADDRTYIRVHDGMDEHPKVEPLSDGAFRLLLTCWFYCSRNRTDGQIVTAVWRRRGTAKTRRELITAGLVEDHGDHVEMHDYLEHQRSAEEIRLLKEHRGDTGTLGNHIRWHVVRRQRKTGCEHCYPEDGSDPIANGSQTRSQTDRKPIASTEAEAEAEAEAKVTRESFKGGSHVSRGAAPEAPPLYADRCKRHGNDPEPPPCGACADVRKAGQQRHLAAVPSEQKRCYVHDETFTSVCRGCRADELAVDGETA